MNTSANTLPAINNETLNVIVNAIAECINDYLNDLALGEDGTFDDVCVETDELYDYCHSHDEMEDVCVNIDFYAQNDLTYYRSATYWDPEEYNYELYATLNAVRIFAPQYIGGECIDVDVCTDDINQMIIRKINKMFS